MSTTLELSQRLTSLVEKNLDKTPSTEDFTLISTLFNDLTESLKTLNWSTSKSIVVLQSKLTYLSTMLKLLSKNYNIVMWKKFLNDLYSVLTNFNLSYTSYSKEIAKTKTLKEKFFLEGNEFAAVLQTPLGFYIVYNKDELRVFNLTSNANGYHIFSDGRFCSGDTYEKLRTIAAEGKIYEFVMLLLNIIGNFDDKAHHLAKPEDFKKYKNDIKLKEWDDETYELYIEQIDKKYTIAMNYINNMCSKEAKKYISKNVEKIKDQLFDKIA